MPGLPHDAGGGGAPGDRLSATKRSATRSRAHGGEADAHRPRGVTWRRKTRTRRRAWRKSPLRRRSRRNGRRGRPRNERARKFGSGSRPNPSPPRRPIAWPPPIPRALNPICLATSCARSRYSRRSELRSRRSRRSRGARMELPRQFPATHSRRTGWWCSSDPFSTRMSRTR